MKKSVTMIASLICLAGLCAGYVGLKNYNDAEDAKEAEAALGEEIWAVDTETLNGLAFWVGETEYHFVKTEDTWKMSEDETFPVNESALLGVLDGFTPLLAQRSLEDVEDAAEYGMDTPQNVLTLNMEDGSEKVVTIGDTNEGTQDDYLKFSDSETIYTVDASVREGISAELYDYAKSENLPDISADSVTKVVVSKTDSEFTLSKEADVWNVTEGEVTEKAYESYVNQLLSDVSGLAYVKFVEHSCQDFSTYGLAEPTAVVNVSYMEEEAEKSMTLYVGGIDDSANYYTNLEGSKEVHTMSSITMGDLLEYSFDSLLEPETESETETEESETESTSEKESEEDS